MDWLWENEHWAAAVGKMHYHIYRFDDPVRPYYCLWWWSEYRDLQNGYYLNHECQEAATHQDARFAEPEHAQRVAQQHWLKLQQERE